MDKMQSKLSAAPIESTEIQIQQPTIKIIKCDRQLMKSNKQLIKTQLPKSSPISQNQNNRDEEKINNLKTTIPDINTVFNIHKRIGSGTFSTVFLASIKQSHSITDSTPDSSTKDDINSEDKKNENLNDGRKLYAIKHIIPTSSPQRIVKELRCLVDIGGVDNVIGIKLCLRRNENVAFVMPYIEHDKFQSYYEKMSLSEVQSYMKNLLIALRRVHKFNIIHRDVKPSNFLYNRKTKEFLLIDFGLAQSVINHRSLIETTKEAASSLLKRKITDELQDNQTSESVDSTSTTNKNNPNKKVCYDKSLAAVEKSPEKMPLKQINGVTLGVVSSTTGLIIPNTTGSGEHSVSQHNSKNSKSQKSESPNNNTHQEADSNNQQNNNKKIIFQQSPNLSLSNVNTVSPSIGVNVQSKQPINNKCGCFGKPQVCKICLLKKEIPASRAGTPGYRPPEVLLKYTEQTTAVDIWAVGVIFISILSGVYPFFKATDDFHALAEIIMLFGDETIRKTAYNLGRQVTISRKCKPLNLRRLCVRLRNRSRINRNELLEKYKKNGKSYEECSNCQQMSFDCLCENTKFKIEDIGEDIFPNSAYDFLTKLLEVNPHKRITAAKALQHPFLREKFD